VAGAGGGVLFTAGAGSAADTDGAVGGVLFTSAAKGDGITGADAASAVGAIGAAGGVVPTSCGEDLLSPVVLPPHGFV